MNDPDTLIQCKERLQIRSLLPDTGIGPAREEIMSGLRARDKFISSKFFYNHRGTELYEQITQLKEYYPSRIEKAILRNIAPSLMQTCRGYDIIELGPGDHSKISLLLEASEMRQDLHYLPLDISESAIRKLSEILVRRFHSLEIEAWIMDFTSQFGMIRRERPSLICFFGSTIGNFTMDQAREFLRKLSADMQRGDHLLLGMDLVKNEEVLHAAYNDSKGVTAAFNLNILSSVNEILGSDFREGDFIHVAQYNREESRIEMFLQAIRNVQVTSPWLDQPVAFSKSERVHTENSHKYTQEHIIEFADYSGLDVVKINKDDRQWFALVEFVKP
jgi:L-histidine N-alpha-methyltransferase